MKAVDMHCDTIYALYCQRERLGLNRSGQDGVDGYAGQDSQSGGSGGSEETKGFGGLRENDGHLDLMRMKEGHYLLQNFALFVELDRDGDPWERVCALYRYYQEELERNRDIVAPVLRYSDIAANEAAGKLSAMLTVEEGAVCRGEAEKLRQLYQMGVRMITLTWNFDNELGCPNRLPHLRERMRTVREAWEKCAPDDPLREEKFIAAQKAYDAYRHTPDLTGGLTERGRELTAQMEQLGIIPDVSHLSDAGFYDVLEVTKKPFAASHSNARAVCPDVRNMTDDMIRKLSERGGVMGLNYCADFLEEKPMGVENPGTIQAVVRHAKHIAATGGIDVLGLGSDFDGIDTNEELPGAQSMERLWDALHRAGFSERELDKIFYQNVLRVYRDTLAG